jgi:hypothetical protein
MMNPPKAKQNMIASIAIWRRQINVKFIVGQVIGGVLRYANNTTNQI